MTRKIALTVGIAAAALAVGVPTAFAGNPTDSHERALGASQPIDAVAYFRANELATLVQSGPGSLGRYADAGQRAEVIRPDVSNYRDGGVRSEPTQSSTLTSVDDGAGLEWPQLGIGFGIGVLLAVGFILAMRMTKVRPLAH